MNKWQITAGDQREDNSGNLQRTPDFVISGAMKSGTSTLHAILAKHDDIFIPEQELHFFDHDNIIEHPNFQQFSHQNGGQWVSNTLSTHFDEYRQWYSKQFAMAKPGSVIGEDSTTYIASPAALKRLGALEKPCKVIVMLRHPTLRAYSQYWHELRAGRAIYTFEDTLQFSPSSVLSRSQYVTQLKSLYEYLPTENIKIILFEDFLQNKRSVINDVCDFLGVDGNALSDKDLTLHANAARLPRFIRLQRLKNHYFRRLGNNGYREHFPPTNKNNEFFALDYLIERLHRVINPLVVKQTPAIHSNTKTMLDDFFQIELQELNDVVGKNVLSTWFD